MEDEHLSDLKSIEKILIDGDLTKLIGMPEGLWFEAKRKDAYDLNSENYRIELSKDVSSFANAEGGFIVIGLCAERSKNKHVEVVNSFDLVSQKIFEESRSQYEGIVKDYIHPRLDNLEIKWIKHSDSSDGIFYIYIPPQNQNNKYFLMRKVIIDNSVLKQKTFGIAIRKKDASDPLKIEDLHKKVQRGISSTSERLIAIEDKIDVLIEMKEKHATPTISPFDQLKNRIDEIK